MVFHSGAAAPPYPLSIVPQSGMPVRRNFPAGDRSEVGGIDCHRDGQTFAVSRNSTTAFPTHALSGSAYGRNVSAVPACAL